MAKRGRKSTKEKNGYYFYDAEEEAVVRYINSNDKEEKNQIYNEVLKPAFDKMINSIIRRYKLYVPDEEHQHTFDDTLSYLLSKIGNFNPDKGKKAYSYCGTIVVNYLKSKLTTLSKQQQRILPFNDVMEEVNNGFDYDLDETSSEDLAANLVNSISVEIKNMIGHAEEYGLTEGEIKTGIAICELLEN